MSNATEVEAKKKSIAARVADKFSADCREQAAVVARFTVDLARARENEQTELASDTEDRLDVARALAFGYEAAAKAVLDAEAAAEAKIKAAIDADAKRAPVQRPGAVRA